MRLFTTLAALAACLLAPSLVRADDELLRQIMRSFKLDASNAAAVALISDSIGLSPNEIVSMGRDTGVSPLEYGPAVIYSHRTLEPFDRVWARRKQGWGEIAHSIGMHPGTFNKLRKQGYSVDEIIWMNQCQRHYGINDTDYRSWRNRGYSKGRIIELVCRNDGNRTKLVSAFKSRPVSAKRIHVTRGKSSGHAIVKGKGPTKSGSSGKSTLAPRGKGPSKPGTGGKSTLAPKGKGPTKSGTGKPPIKKKPPTKRGG